MELLNLRYGRPSTRQELKMETTLLILYLSFMLFQVTFSKYIYKIQHRPNINIYLQFAHLLVSRSNYPRRSIKVL